jgi:hypothetical protein
MRANGGAVDSVGTFRLGTMNDPEEADITNEAVLFRLDADGSFHRVLDQLGCEGRHLLLDRHSNQRLIMHLISMLQRAISAIEGCPIIMVKMINPLALPMDTQETSRATYATLVTVDIR